MSTIESDFRIKNGIQVAGNAVVAGNTNLQGTNNQVGTITSGTWNATAISRQYGGFGQNTTGLSGYVFFNGAITTASPTIPASAITGTLSSATVSWTQVTSKPTTLSGYGITDNIAIRNADGTLTLAQPQEMNQAVTAQYFFDNNFLNFEPKVGKGNDHIVGITSKFDYSWMEGVGVTIVNEYDEECVYYIASDGSSQPDMFKARKLSTETSWLFDPDAVRPPFLTATEFITAVHGGSNDWLLVTIANTSPSSSTLTLIRTNNLDSPVSWNRTAVPVGTISSNAKMVLAQNRAVDLVAVSGQFVLRIFDTQTWTQLGTDRSLFNFTADIDYTHPTITSVSGISLRHFSPMYVPSTNNLFVVFGIMVTALASGTTGLRFQTFTLSYDIPPSVMSTGVGQVTSLIPNSTHLFFGPSTGQTEATRRYSFDEPTNTVFLVQHNFWNTTNFLFNKTTITRQFDRSADFWWSPTLSFATPDSSPWSKSVRQLMLFPNNMCMFAGVGTSYGGRWMIGEYTLIGTTMSIVPGRWRLFDARPSTAPTSVLDNAVPANFQHITNQQHICVTFDHTDTPLFLFCTGPGQAIHRITIDSATLMVSVTPYNVVGTSPSLPAGYVAAGNWGFDPKRNVFYYAVRKTGEFNSTRVLAFSAGVWTESPLINEHIANSSRSHFHGTAVNVSAINSTTSNILIDQSGDVYVNQTYMGVGDVLQAPYNRLTFDGTAFTVEQGLTNIPAWNNTYVMSFSNEGFTGTRTTTPTVRWVDQTQSIVARTAFITGVNRNIIKRVTGSVGLIAYISAQDVFVAGQWSRLQPTSVTLLPNTINYIYVRRNTNDVRILEVFTSTRRMNNTFSRVLIGDVTTNASDPVSQNVYTVNETTARWPNISEKPTLTLTGAITGSISLVSPNLSLPTTLSTTGVAGGTYTRVTVGTDGRVSSGTNPTTLAGYGITDAVVITNTNTQIASLGVGVAASGTTGEIRATNDVTAFFSSDARLKKNVTPIANALDKVNQIRGVEFDWSDEYIASKGGIDEYFVRRHDVGVIAQEIQQVLPEVVSQRTDGTLAVKYDRIVSLLIEAIKELKQEVETLKAGR